MQAEQVFVLTMVLALAAIEAVEEVRGLSPLIKWTNDLYIGDKKLGGILTEFEVTGKDVEYVVQGLWLNVNWNPGDDVSIRMVFFCIILAKRSIWAVTDCANDYI
jgi:biotin-(acetyl-CoA carboxylase) ligase